MDLTHLLFRCNDKENDRWASDSILSERALREIYLMPFMLAQKNAQPWAFMTACVLISIWLISERILMSIAAITA